LPHPSRILPRSSLVLPDAGLNKPEVGVNPRLTADDLGDSEIPKVDIGPVSAKVDRIVFDRLFKPTAQPLQSDHRRCSVAMDGNVRRG